MRTFAFNDYVLSVGGAAALLAGCGQSQGAFSPPAALPALAQSVPRGSGEVQYFSNEYGTYLTEFDYPKGQSQIGQIANVSGGICTKGARTFWVVAGGTDEIEEFKAGGTTAIKTLTESSGQPASCAVDAATGDLAATILSNGDVVIFKRGSDSGTTLSSGLSEAFFDGYDASGNLFVDGFNGSDAFELVELPKGSSSFEGISISNTGSFPNAVQWDGRYLTIGCGSGICRYRIAGTKAILKGIVRISCSGYWIARPYVYCADAGNDDGEVFKYPAGGSPIATLTGSFDLPLGVVSLRVR